VATFADLLRPLIVKAADAGANLTIDHQQQIVDFLRSYEAKGIDALAADLKAAIPTQSLGEKITHGEVLATIDNLAAILIAKLPAEDNQLLDTLEAWLENISATAAGNT
jgi:hypothetical protein